MKYKINVITPMICNNFMNLLTIQDYILQKINKK